MRESVHLLHDHNLSIKEIAHTIGRADSAYFFLSFQERAHPPIL